MHPIPNSASQYKTDMQLNHLTLLLHKITSTNSNVPTSWIIPDACRKTWFISIINLIKSSNLCKYIFWIKETLHLRACLVGVFFFGFFFMFTSFNYSFVLTTNLGGGVLKGFLFPVVSVNLRRKLISGKVERHHICYVQQFSLIFRGGISFTSCNIKNPHMIWNGYICFAIPFYKDFTKY